MRPERVPLSPSRLWANRSNWGAERLVESRASLYDEQIHLVVLGAIA
jgi:hypothetical protein